MRAGGGFALLAMIAAACQPVDQQEAQTKTAMKIPSDAKETTGAPKEKLGSDWNDLFGYFVDPAKIDGREGGPGYGSELYACPDQPDNKSFVNSLWPKWRKVTDAIPKPTPQDWSWDDSMESVREHIFKSGCKRHLGIVAVSSVLVWDDLTGGGFKNDDRWIAFKAIGQNKGFYLVLIGSVD